MNRDKALKLLRDNLYLVSTITRPPTVMDIEYLVGIEQDPAFPWDTLGLMITLDGRKALEVAKAVCPPRRRIIVPGAIPTYEEENDASEAVSDGPKLIEAK